MNPINHEMSERQQKVVDTLLGLGIEFDIHFHPPIPTIEEAINYWKEFDSTHCKNLFFRNHKGNKHYLVLFECMHQMDINDTEHHVHVFIDQNLQKAERLSFHPNDNTATIVIRNEDFIKFLNAMGNSYEFIELY